MSSRGEAGAARARTASGAYAPPITAAHRPTVFVVDDDASSRDSLSWLVKSVGLAVETFADARQFLEAYDGSRPGCLLLDVRLPGMGGLDLLDELNARRISIPTIVVTAFGEVRTAVRALRGGACDFLEKPFGDQNILDRIQHAIQTDRETRAANAAQAGARARLARLTPREREVMERVIDGKANKVIAQELKLSEKTVEAHRAKVMHKLEVGSVAMLVRLVLSGR